MKKNVIFIFKKIPIKRKTKNIYCYFRHFFHFLLCFFFLNNKKGKSWIKIGQKSWVFIIPHRLNTLSCQYFIAM
jgi:uncharacterized membrane protein